MALLGKFDESYTRTGNNLFTSFSNWMSLLPIANVPLIGAPFKWIAAAGNILGSGIEALSWLVQGKPLSALTVAATGTVSAGINAISAVPGVMWFVNAGSVATTGRTAGTHGRKITEEVIGGITGVFGVKPTVLRSYPAGIGYIGGGMNTAGPGQFATMEAQRRGQDPNAYYQSKMNGEMGQHLADLESARSRPNYQGVA